MDDFTEKISVQIPARSRYASMIRRVSDEVGRFLGLSEEDINRVKLCVDEAVTNVIRHCYKEESKTPIRVTFFPVKERKLVIEIRDFGDKVDVEKIRPRDLDDVKPHGLGVHFIRTLMDSWEYDESVREGNLLRLTKNLGEQKIKEL